MGDMFRRFQFSLARLFWATAWLSVTAVSVSALARCDYVTSGDLIFVWIAMAISSTGGAFGAMTADRPVLGAFRSAGFGILLLAFHLIFKAPLAMRYPFAARVSVLLAMALLGVYFEHARCRWGDTKRKRIAANRTGC